MPETGIYSGYAISSVIKKFFNEMPLPIVPYKVYNKIINLTNIKEEEELEVVKNMIS